MNYFFAEIKDNKIFSLHETTSLDLLFRNSDGLLVEITEKEYNLLKACRGDIAKGISDLKKVQIKIFDKVAEQ